MTDIEPLKTALSVALTDAPEDHLSDPQWESLACGDLDREERDAALDYILDCRECTAIHQALLVLRDRAHTFDSGAPKPESAVNRLNRGWVYSSVLAVAAMLIVIIVRQFGPSPTDPGLLRSSDPILRSSPSDLPATLLSPTGETSMSDVRFSWTPAPAASLSIVQLIDSHGEVVWTSRETEETAIDWPDDVAMRAGSYYWRVLSLGGTTGSRHASDLMALELIEPSPTNHP